MSLDLSIVIPSYNSASRLKESLRRIARQDEVDPSRFEVVVVDDGSTDDTAQSVRDFGPFLRSLKYVFRDRDSLSCRARARNIGIENAQGRTLLFMDAGVLPGPGLLRYAFDEAGNNSERVVIYKTLGLFAEASGASPEEFANSLNRERLAELAATKGWRDGREPFMAGLEDSNRRLPGEWLLAWTCALSLSRGAALSVSGFDAEYRGWGVEDVDFAARLEMAGLSFHWASNAFAVHIPHRSSEDRSRDHAHNAKRLHRKLCTRETELFAHWNDGFAVNVFGARLDDLALERVTPPCSFPTRPLLGGGRTLCSGLRWSPALKDLEPSVALVHRRPLVHLLEALWPKASVRCLLGVSLPFLDNEFDQAIIGDLVRLMPEDLRTAYLQEMARVAHRVVAVVSTEDGYEHRFRRLAGWAWASVDEFASSACVAGLAVEESRALSTDTVALVLRKARQP